MHFILSTLSMEGFAFLFWLFTFLSIFTVSSAIDSINANGIIADGETIVSAGDDFELGFFDPGNSKRYLGVWYKKLAHGTVAWVANRDSPLNDTSGVLQLSEHGNLLLSDGSGDLIWSSSNTSKVGVKTPVARLLDTGNFVVTDGENTKTLWQSFDYIGDSFLPGMKLGRDLLRGLDRYLLSWKSVNDPASGEYSIKLNTSGYPQFFVMKGSEFERRWGPWNGIRFSGTPHMTPNNHIFTYEFVFNEDEIYYRFELVNRSILTRTQLDPLGAQRRLIWVDPQWKTFYVGTMDDCDTYAACGAYGICNIDNLPTCGCLSGFKPKFPIKWGLGDWSDGCVKKLETICGAGETFTRIRKVKLPDTTKSWYNGTINLKDCEMLCMKNCSCTAYANQDIRGGGSGCLLWFSELMDIRVYSGAEQGQDLYIRIASSELGPESNSFRKKMVIIMVTSVMIVVVLVGFIYILHERRKRKRRFEEEELQNHENDAADDENQENLDLPLFDFSIIADATDDFSDDNKIGEGGYGPVYWGKLKDGQEIAVKRLSKESKQGLGEFKNEVALIAKLQHRNLVKLLGCCIQEKEKILIYEYLPNKSLDFFIFGQGSSIAMDWSLRCQIINGIARGLLYLHQDSRLRIIHRDLKASNILLDNNMNPKISDFGIAKGIGGDETEANTLTVVGTYGYMSPEYIIDGAFSVKSDVFSFGVLLLEIISGKRNRRFQHHGHNHNLLGHAWKLFQEGRSSELIDASVSSETLDEPQVLRYIQVGLLCVQQSPEDRPIMASVVVMLSSGINLPLPKEPGFFAERQLCDEEGTSSSSMSNFKSVNRITLTAPTPR